MKELLEVVSFNVFLNENKFCTCRWNPETRWQMDLVACKVTRACNGITVPLHPVSLLPLCPFPPLFPFPLCGCHTGVGKSIIFVEFYPNYYSVIIRFWQKCKGQNAHFAAQHAKMCQNVYNILQFSVINTSLYRYNLLITLIDVHFAEIVNCL